LDLGVEFNRNGTLDFNAEKFKKIVNTDPKDVVKFLRGNNVDVGFIPQLVRQVKDITDPNVGVIGARKTNYKSRIKQMDDQIDRKEKSLVRREEQIRNKFAKMEEAMSKIQSQGAQIK
jgi:flagellar hook-associated protein 2